MHVDQGNDYNSPVKEFFTPESESSPMKGHDPQNDDYLK